MTKNLPTLGELEIHVLRLVWQLQPCTERELWDAVQQERSVGRTTVLKTIQRLEGKELLSRKDGTSPVQYLATIEEERVMPTLVQRFVSGVLGGDAEPLVSYLAGSDKLSAKDLAQLREIARKIGTDAADQ